MFDYIRHLVLIGGVAYDNSIRDVQERLRRLQLSLLRHTRIMVLQLPFWTTFALSSKWFPRTAGAGYIAFQVLLTGTFVWLAVWLYRKHTPENLGDRWVRPFISGIGGSKLLRAMRFYQELEELGS